MLGVVALVMLLVGAFGYAYWYITVRAVVEGDFRPSIHLRVDKILSPYEGQAAPPELLVELQGRVEEVVENTLFELHRSDEEVRVIVRNDEILGPVCFVRTPDGNELPLAEYERRLG